MKKLGVLFRESLENQIKDQLQKSSSVFIIDYSKLSSPELTTLRQSLIGTNARLFVVKNNMARRALKDARYESVARFIEGPCGLIFIQDEPVDASRVLSNFSKAHEQFTVRGGILGDKVLESKDIATMASLPRKEVLLAQAVMVLNSPISGFVGALNQILRKFVYCLEQIRIKKGS